MNNNRLAYTRSRPTRLGLPSKEPYSMPHQPEEKLDAENFVRLVVAHETRVRAFISSLMLPTSDVDDVFQSTCMAAFRKMSDFRFEGSRPEEAFVRWVCTIAKYEVLTYYRRQRTGKVSFSTEVVEKVADLQIETMDLLQDKLDALRVCIDSLEDKEKSLIAMRYGEAVPVTEIGKVIGLTTNGVYKAPERVRARLLGCIRARLRAGGLS